MFFFSAPRGSSITKEHMGDRASCTMGTDPSEYCDGPWGWHVRHNHHLSKGYIRPSGIYPVEANPVMDYGKLQMIVCATLSAEAA